MVSSEEPGFLDRLKSLSEWSLYHKVVGALLFGALLWVIFQFWYAHTNGAYRVTDSAIIKAPAERVWGFVASNENRVRWQAHIVKITRVNGDPDTIGSTRLLSWRNTNWRTWTAFERTTTLTPGLFYATLQRTEKDERALEITLEPINDCATRVTLEERIKPKSLDDRFVAPFQKVADMDRFDRSLIALQRWADLPGGCQAP